MSVHPVGSRIAAIRNADNATIYLFGRGVYAGDFPRPGSGNWSPQQYDVVRSVITADTPERTAELRVADDAFMVRKLDECVAEGKKTREEADQSLAEYRRIRAEREAKRASMSVDEQVVELLTEMDRNPRLDLDGGGTVWGCECWWMPEEQFEASIGDRNVVIVPEPVREGV